MDDILGEGHGARYGVYNRQAGTAILWVTTLIHGHGCGFNFKGSPRLNLISIGFLAGFVTGKESIADCTNSTRVS